MPTVTRDNLQVMASLAEREGLRVKVQCIYIDPSYGIKFSSNSQWSTTSRDVREIRPSSKVRWSGSGAWWRGDERLSAEGLEDVFHQQDRVQIIRGRLLELGDEVEVEVPRLRRLGMDEQAAAPDLRA